MVTALLELADEGSLVYDPAAKRLVARLRSDIAHTPFQLKMAEVYPDGKTGFVGMLGAEKRIVERMFEKGWADTNGQLTAEGEKLLRSLIGYRDYLRKAMVDRIHFEVIRGRAGRDALFAVGLGIMSLPNAHRAVALRAGSPVNGMLRNLFDVLGGKAERQHAISADGGRPPTTCLGLLIFWVLGATAFFIWLFLSLR